MSPRGLELQAAMLLAQHKFAACTDAKSWKVVLLAQEEYMLWVRAYPSGARLLCEQQLAML